MSQINYQAIFDGNDLTTVTGLTVLASDPYKLPKRNFNVYPIARTNRSKGQSAFFDKRVISVRVSITRATRDLLEQSNDALNTLLQGVEKQLVLAQSGGQRMYICTYVDDLPAKDGGSFIERTLVFECSDRYGYDLQPTLLSYLSAQTASSLTTAVTVGGSAQWQAPVFTYTFSALSGGTSKTVIIGNNLTSQLITVSRTWAAGDLLVIDCYNHTVTVNGADVAFTGAWPYFVPGSGTISYSDTLTTRTYSAQVTYLKAYL